MASALVVADTKIYSSDFRFEV